MGAEGRDEEDVLRTRPMQFALDALEALVSAGDFGGEVEEGSTRLETLIFFFGSRAGEKGCRCDSL